MILGINSDDVFHNQSAEISYMDANTAEWSFIELEDGHMPEAYNEIVMDKEALKLLGYEPVLGEQIDLSFEINGKGEDQSGYQNPQPCHCQRSPFSRNRFHHSNHKTESTSTKPMLSFILSI